MFRCRNPKIYEPMELILKCKRHSRTIVFRWKTFCPSLVFFVSVCVAFCRFQECGGNFMLIGVWLKSKLNTNFVCDCAGSARQALEMQIFVLSKHSIWFWLFSSLWWPQLFWLQSIMFRLMFKYLESRLTSITVIIRYLRITGDEEKTLSHFPTLVFGFILSFSSLQCYNIY